MTTLRTATPTARALGPATLAGLALTLTLAAPAAAQSRQRTAPPTTAAHPPLTCPDGWKAATTPPVSGQLRCLPGTFVAGTPTDPAMAERKPELFCPRGWKPAAPPVSWQLRCLPDQLTSGGGSEPGVVTVVVIPRKAGLPLDMRIEGQPVGTLARPGGLTTPSPGYQLTLQQLATTAVVPMKHGSCGLDCNTHVLAGGGNLNLPAEVGMQCPAGTTVVYLAAGATKVVENDSGQQNYSSQVGLQPFTAQDLEQACQAALGGSWPVPGSHANTSQTVQAQATKKVKLSGRCSGWANTVYKDFDLNLTLTCQDESWFTPVG